jgi:hypothetical protein
VSRAGPPRGLMWNVEPIDFHCTRRQPGERVHPSACLELRRRWGSIPAASICSRGPVRAGLRPVLRCPRAPRPRRGTRLRPLLEIDAPWRAASPRGAGCGCRYDAPTSLLSVPVHVAGDPASRVDAAALQPSPIAARPGATALPMGVTARRVGGAAEETGATAFEPGLAVPIPDASGLYMGSSDFLRFATGGIPGASGLRPSRSGDVPSTPGLRPSAAGDLAPRALPGSTEGVV